MNGVGQSFNESSLLVFFGRSLVFARLIWYHDKCCAELDPKAPEGANRYFIFPGIYGGQWLAEYKARRGGAVPAKRIGEWRPVAWFGHCATTRNRWWMTMVMNDRTASGTGEIRDVHRPQVRRRVDREPQSVRRAALLENGPRRHRNRNGLRQLQRVSTQSSIFFYTSSFYSSLSSKSYHNGLTYP